MSSANTPHISSSSSPRPIASRNGSISDSSSVENFCEQISQRLGRLKAPPQHTLRRQAICGCARSEPLPRSKRSPRDILHEHRIFLKRTMNDIDPLMASTCCDLCGLVLPPRQGVRPPWQPFPSIGNQSAYEIHAHNIQMARPDHSRTGCVSFEAVNIDLTTATFGHWEGFSEQASAQFIHPAVESEPPSPTFLGTFESQYHDGMDKLLGTSWNQQTQSMSSRSSFELPTDMPSNGVQHFTGLYDLTYGSDPMKGIILLDEEVCQSPETLANLDGITHAVTSEVADTTVDPSTGLSHLILPPDPRALFRTRTWSLYQSPDLSPIAEGVEEGMERKYIGSKLRHETALLAVGNRKTVEELQHSIEECWIGEMQVARIQKLTIYRGAAVKQLCVSSGGGHQRDVIA